MDTRVSTFIDNQALAGTLFKRGSLQPRRAAGGIGYAIFTTAFDALRSNRLRSFLTMLGLIIGTSAVIAVVTLTQGVTESVNQSFSSLGTNVLTISPGATSSRGASSGLGSAQTLTVQDAEAISQLPGVTNWSPVINASGQVIYSDQNTSTSVRGVYPDYQTIQNLVIAQGSWFTDEDEQMATPVAVIGDTTASNLFIDPTVSPIGQDIRIGAQDFRVVGILQAKGSQGPGNQDDVIYVPFSAAFQRLNPSNYVSQMVVQADQTSDVTPVQTEITTLLRSRHHLSGPDPALFKQNGTSSRAVTSFGGGGGGYRGGGGGGGGFQRGGGAPPSGGNTSSSSSSTSSNSTSSNSTSSSSTSKSGTSTTRTAASDPPDDFQIFNTDQLIETAQQNSSVLTTLLIGVAAISLTVGGIGIMNIMLVSVTERLREIGICKAIGARERDIRNQFLLEALLLTIAGGIAGIVIGLGVGFLLTLDLHVPFVLSVVPAVVAFGVSTVIGVTFGLYPAIRASKLDPIMTLRTA
jgi:ABC-type antimicrobial peptide transport system permease subunit